MRIVKPDINYTKSGSINIAYQVFGQGTIDLVYIPGWVSNIDWVWECPELVSFLKELGKHARVILFDKRGTGLSDRLSEISTLEERMDDIRAVMDAVSSEKAVLFGHSEGGSVSALFAATYPNRVVTLIMFGAFAKRRYSADYPWAPTDEQRQQVYDMIERNWGTTEMGLESLAPSKAMDKNFMKWLANYFRSGASPKAALVLTKMNTQVDIRNVLGSIKVPTLILQRTNDIDVKIDEGKFLADHIQNSKFVELEGNDHLFWIGKTEDVLIQIRKYISYPESRKNEYEKQLLTIAAARICSDVSIDFECKELMHDLMIRHNGKELKCDNELLVSSFEGPSKAVEFSLELLKHAKHMGIQLAIGVDMKEVFCEEARSLSPEIMSHVKTFADKVNPNQILLTHTVKYLLSGSDLILEENSLLYDGKTGDSIQLFEVCNHEDEEGQAGSNLGQGNSFLDLVISCINQHLNKVDFNVSELCKTLGVSERQLQRKIKNTTNKTPNQLIVSVRMYRAKELLRTKKYNIAETAYEVGFSSPSYFTRIFKKEFGISPSGHLA